LGTPRGHKGVDDLVEAVRALGDGVLLALVGADPSREGTRRWRQASFVKLVGEIPFDDVPRWLAAAAGVAVPPRARPRPVGQVPAKLFDAMALARPIVSTSVSMIPEILAGCGVVVPPGDVTALSGGIRQLLTDRPAAEALGRAARVRCQERYSFATARATL